MIHLEDITEEVEIPQPGEINLFGKFFGDIIPLSCIGVNKTMNNQPFEDFLKDKHFELNPQLLDDDLPDAFDNWLGTLDGEDYIKYGNEALSETQRKSVYKELIRTKIERVCEWVNDFKMPEEVSKGIRSFLFKELGL